MDCLQFLVSGKVQGVGFRAYVRDQAQSLYIQGWVRNRADGTVEVCACGRESALAAFGAALSVGPKGARVARVDRARVDRASFSGFVIRYDGP